ncbi:MAG: hypothetical protein HYX42_08245 [Polaromonas sp.]|uniref:hypothetical protein n=1 Tax=Polaromonas sp. TaxID=1869339 RepID=UPI0025CEE04F|nr:hypothetical protein [Polaromonas sp.]MBI2726224.1 hypothetical protein [Polaromonas sp.]
MDKLTRNFVLEEIQNEAVGIDVFSKEYFFDSKYAKHRSEVVVFGGSLSHRSRLSILIREGLNNVRRKKIFDSDFQLGNRRALAPSQCTYESLTHELWPGTIKPEANDAFETIQNWIPIITGRKIGDHAKTNKSTTFKVLYTLKRLMMRNQRLFDLLRPPNLENWSLAFGDAYGYKKNQEQVWLVADLKAYLSAELSHESIQRIGDAYRGLGEWKNSVLQLVPQALSAAYAADPIGKASAFKALADELGKFQVSGPLNVAPLDEILFSHVLSLDEQHLHIGYSKLLMQAVPQISVTPIRLPLKRLTNLILTAEQDEEHEFIEIQKVCEVANKYREEIISLMQLALDSKIKPPGFNSIVEAATNLLHTRAVWGRNGKGLFQDRTALVSVLEMIAAFCCVWHTQMDGTEVMPYWPGQKTQGKRVTTSFKQAPLPIPDITVDEIPEEHRHFLTYRFEWFTNALRGHQELIQQEFAFRSAIAKIVADLSRTNNPGYIVDTPDIINALIQETAWRILPE